MFWSVLRYLIIVSDFYTSTFNLIEYITKVEIKIYILKW